MSNAAKNGRDAYPPTEADFDPYEGDLDAQCAWRNFGGLTLEQAAAKFRERPDIYQEDFMFMGGRAFAFYFTVIVGYLHSFQDEKTAENDDGDDHEAWILAKCIQNQFAGRTAQFVRHLAEPVLTLSQHVRQDIACFAYEPREQRRIVGAWIELETHVRGGSNDGP